LEKWGSGGSVVRPSTANLAIWRQIWSRYVSEESQRPPKTVLYLDLHQSAMLVVRFGSKADISERIINVRVTNESGH
jgi:hypothetical protein